MRYISSEGKIELKLTKKQAQKGSHSGQCAFDIAELRKVPSIKRQLEKLSIEDVKNELKSSGAYEDEELENHNENLTRILWFACCDISENIKQIN